MRACSSAAAMPSGAGVAEELVEQPHGLVVVAARARRPGPPVQALRAPRASPATRGPARPPATSAGAPRCRRARLRTPTPPPPRRPAPAPVRPPRTSGGRAARPARTPGQRQREPAVQVDALARQQVGRHHLGHQPVPQPVAVAALVDHDDAVRHGLPSASKQGGGGQPEHLGQQLVARRARGGRDRPHHLLPVGREHRDRLSTTSRKVVGRPRASPPSTARTVSSAMNALPADRCQTSPSRSDRPGAHSATSSATTARGSGAAPAP